MIREDLNEKGHLNQGLKEIKGNVSSAFSGQETKCRGSRADVCCLRNSKKKKKKERRGERRGKDEGKRGNRSPVLHRLAGHYKRLYSE